MRARAFSGSAARGSQRSLRVGLEMEAIPVDAATGRPVPLRSATGPSGIAVLDALAERHGWRRLVNAAGAPAYRVPSGGQVSFEPGGQIEYSAPPFESVTDLLEDVGHVLNEVGREASRHGIRLLARGVDPFNPPEVAPMQLDGERYTRMAAHFGRQGPAGHCMMCQTAALHVNVDPVGSFDQAWRAANAMAPVLLATFANSSVYAGAPTGSRSWRAEQWRRLDGRRTGVFAPASDPVDDYLAFALDAPAFLLGDPREETRPFRDWLERGASHEDFDRHLTTLFPEVRPRGYLELRSIDALPLGSIAAAVVVTVGVLQDLEALDAALDLLPVPTAESLGRAGRIGLADPETASLARSLFQIGIEGAERLGTHRVGGREIESAQAFFDGLTARGLDPASRGEDGLLSG